MIMDVDPECLPTMVCALPTATSIAHCLVHPWEVLAIFLVFLTCHELQVLQDFLQGLISSEKCALCLSEVGMPSADH